MKVNSKNGIGAKGFDLVSYLEGTAIKGKPDMEAEHEGTRYLFSTHENKIRFEKSPGTYVPAYGGYCAIAMSEGKEADPNPKSFKIQDGRLYLFTRMLWGIIDVKRQWEKDPKGKKLLADQHWKRIGV